MTWATWDRLRRQLFRAHCPLCGQDRLLRRGVLLCPPCDLRPASALPTRPPLEP